MGDRLVQKNQELSILNRIAAALNREVDLHQALHVALGNIVDLFNLDTGWIFLLDEDTEKFYTAATIGLPPALADHPRRMGGTCYCIDAYVDGEMEGAANIAAITCSRLKDLKAGTEGLRYHASIALNTQDKQLGILNVASTDWREISAAELRLLHTIGDLMSIAIERARLFQRSTELGATQERNRIARELHDTIAQGLTAIALKLETADVLLENTADGRVDKAQATIREALALAQTNLEEARRSVADLRAIPLEGHTLAEAIGLLVNDLPNATVEIIGSCPPPPIRIASSLYRIAQEAVNNAQQHASATRIQVQLHKTPERLRLIVEDNGIGFDICAAYEGHYGLVGMKERVRLLGGQIDIVSAVGQGTLVEVMIPLGTTHD